jgi:propionyl-CoA carboxylase alpha chain/3-methylcrotonyl-CoA carboxylase alpha subunit
MFYDPMIAKLIVHAGSREEAARRLADVCGQVEVWPVKANAGFLKRCLEHPRFVAGDVDTGFIAAEEADLIPAGVPGAVVAAAFIARTDIEDYYRSKMHGDGQEIWRSSSDALYGLRLNGPPWLERRLQINGLPVMLRAQPQEHNQWWTLDAEDGRWIGGGTSGVFVTVGREGEDALTELHMVLDQPVLFHEGQAYVFGPVTHGAAPGSGLGSDGSLCAPMPGKIVATPAKPGDAVTKGQPVVVLEAMKMEHALVAPFDGVVGEIGVAVGDQVSADAVLAVVTAAD